MTDLLPPPAPPPPPPSPPRSRGARISRRRLLGAGIGGAVALAAGGLGIDRWVTGGAGPGEDALPPNGTPQRFVSRPDLEPTVTRLQVSGPVAPGLWFVGPGRSAPVDGGPMIVDAHGDLVWFRPLPLHVWATNLRPAVLHGRPVLIWWEGRLNDAGYGVGEAVIADTSYRELHRVRAARGRHVDLHEFQLTDAGTALFTCTPTLRVTDLSALGGPSSAQVLESIFQEVDVPSGRLIREWRSLDHVPVTDTYRTEFAPLDYLHVNSIDVLADGDLLVSARNTWCCYKLDRASGRIVWRIGGRASDFAMGAGAQYAWQHDARWVGAGRMTVFDDGFDGRTRSHRRSRGLVLDVDLAGRRVSVARADTSPAGLLSSGMGNAQLLPDGHLLVGFGDDPYSTEFDADGRVVANLQMPHGQHSYRSFRAPWSGRPAEPPAVAVRRGGSGAAEATMYVSWNGATDVAAWRVLAAARRGDPLRPVARAARTGFETAVGLGRGSGVAVAVAVDAAGRELGRSAPVRV
jgi:hypothetical protein